MNEEQKAYAKKISDLKIYIRQCQSIYEKLVQECSHSFIRANNEGHICVDEYGNIEHGANGYEYCEICGNPK